MQFGACGLRWGGIQSTPQPIDHIAYVPALNTYFRNLPQHFHYTQHCAHWSVDSFFLACGLVLHMSNTQIVLNQWSAKGFDPVPVTLIEDFWFLVRHAIDWATLSSSVNWILNKTIYIISDYIKKLSIVIRHRKPSLKYSVIVSDKWS